jgi:type IV pilus assembly protein PilP
MNRKILAAIILGASTWLVVACGDDKVPTKPPPAAGPAPAAAAPAAVASGALGPDAGPIPKGVDYTENDFVESDSNRDPFRGYLANPTDKTAKATPNQRKVLLPEYSVDELKLIGIVQAGDGNSAMLLPSTGKGQIVRRGDYVGRAEIVHVGGANGPEYPLNWRVDKIRDGDIVLIREDPNNSAIPPATRVILLHPEQDKFNNAKSG